MKKSILVVLGLGVAIVAIVVAVVRVHAAKAAREADKAHQDRPVPVSVAIAGVADVPVNVEGLGTVTPLYTVTVKTLVGGTLQQVFYNEGQFVKKGDPLALVDPRPFEVAREQAMASRAKDLATKRNAEITQARDAELQRQGLVAQQQVDNDRAAVDSAAAAVQADEAQVHSADLNITYAHIVSPIDGVTGIRLVDPGNVVQPTDTGAIVVLTELDPITVIFVLPQDELPAVSASQAKGRPPVTAFSRDGAMVLGEGELTVVDNQINQQTATMRLRATMRNPERKLWPNQFVKARLLLETKKGALVIPATAIQKGPQGTFVYVVDDQSRAQVREVSADEIEGDKAIVSKGLSAGERVVTEGQSQLKPMCKVAPQK